MTRLAEADLPEGDVLVDVEWSAINFEDAMVAPSRRPRVAGALPLVPGSP